MARTAEERNKKFWKTSRATGKERPQAMADIARAALAFAGFKDWRVPQQVEPATKVYQTVIPAALQYTDAQWNNNHYEAMASMLDNGPQDEADLALVVHKRNPKTGLTGQKWRITLPDAKAGEPAWFEQARAARATVRAYAVEHKDDILQALLDVDGHNTNVLLQTDAELEEFEALPEDWSKGPASDEDSDDAAKENAGAARGAKAAASKPVKAAKATKKRAASPDCEADDSDFQQDDDVPKAKRAYVRKAAAKEPDADVDFDAAVAAVAVTLKGKVGGMRDVIMRLGLYNPGQQMLEQRKYLGKFAKNLAGGSIAVPADVAAQFLKVLNAEARIKGVAKAPAAPEAGAAAAAEEPDAEGAAEEAEAAAA